MNEIFFYFLQSIPECIGVLALSLALARVGFRWPRIISYSLVTSLGIFAIKNLPIPMGAHLLFGILLTFFFFILMTNVNPSKSFFVVFCSFVIVALIDFSFNGVVQLILQQDSEQLMTNDFLWSVIGIFQGIMINILAICASRIVKPIEGVWKR